MSLADKIFGTYSDRELKKIDGTVNAIMDLEEKYSVENYTDEQLRAKTEEFKKSVQICPKKSDLCQKVKKKKKL